MILSPDHLLIQSDGSYDWTPSRLSSAWRDTILKTRNLLSDPRWQGLVLLIGVPGSGKTTWLSQHEDRRLLYIDATFATRTARIPFLQIGSDLLKPVSAIVFTTPFEECIRRNDLRPPDRRVPPEKMLLFRNQIIREPPSLEDGFISITTVAP